MPTLTRAKGPAKRAHQRKIYYMNLILNISGFMFSSAVFFVFHAFSPVFHMFFMFSFPVFSVISPIYIFSCFHFIIK